MASEGRARGDSLVETVQLEDGLEQPTALVTRGQDYLTKRAILLQQKRNNPLSPRRSSSKAPNSSQEQGGKYHLLRKYLLQQEMDTVFMSEKRRVREETRKKIEEDELEAKRLEEESEKERGLQKKVLSKKEQKIAAQRKRDAKKKAAADEVASIAEAERLAAEEKARLEAEREAARLAALKLEEEKKERLAEEARIKAEKEAAEKKRFREAEAEKRRIKAEKEAEEARAAEASKVKEAERVAAAAVDAQRRKDAAATAAATTKAASPPPSKPPAAAGAKPSPVATARGKSPTRAASPGKKSFPSVKDFKAVKTVTARRASQDLGSKSPTASSVGAATVAVAAATAAGVVTPDSNDPEGSKLEASKGSKLEASNSHMDSPAKDKIKLKKPAKPANAAAKGMAAVFAQATAAKSSAPVEKAAPVKAAAQGLVGTLGGLLKGKVSPNKASSPSAPKSPVTTKSPVATISPKPPPAAAVAAKPPPAAVVASASKPPPAATAKPPSTVAAKAPSAKATLKVDAMPPPEPDGLFWAMKDMDGGYSLAENRRVFKFGDKAAVSQVLFSKTSPLVAIATGDNNVHVSDMSQGVPKILATCEGHTGAITGLSWSSDGKHVATCSQDGHLRVWNAKDGSNAMVPLSLGNPLSATCFHPTLADTLLVADSVGPVHTVSVKEGKVMSTLELKDRVKAIAYAPVGHLVLFGDIKGKIYIYKVAADKLKKMSNEVIADRPITHIETMVVPGGNPEAMVVVNSLSGKIKMGSLKWDIGFAKSAKFEVVKVFPTMNRASTIRAAFCPTLGKWPRSFSIVCGSEDGQLNIYNKDKKGEPWCNMLNGHEATVLGATWSGDGTILVTCDAEGSVVCWRRDISNEE